MDLLGEWTLEADKVMVFWIHAKVAYQERVAQKRRHHQETGAAISLVGLAGASAQKGTVFSSA
jgi:hypothetical protein